jgi:hypothetical protein
MQKLLHLEQLVSLSMVLEVLVEVEREEEEAFLVALVVVF